MTAENKAGTDKIEARRQLSKFWEKLRAMFVEEKAQATISSIPQREISRRFFLKVMTGVTGATVFSATPQIVKGSVNTIGGIPDVKIHVKTTEKNSNVLSDDEKKLLAESGFSEFIPFCESMKKFSEEFGFELPFFQLFYGYFKLAMEGKLNNEILNDQADNIPVTNQLQILKNLSQPWGNRASVLISAAQLRPIIDGNFDEVGIEEKERLKQILHFIFEKLPLTLAIAPLNFQLNVTSFEEQNQLFTINAQTNGVVGKFGNIQLNEGKINPTVILHEILHSIFQFSDDPYEIEKVSSLIADLHVFIDKKTFVEFITHTVESLYECFLAMRNTYNNTNSTLIFLPYWRVDEMAGSYDKWKAYDVLLKHGGDKFWFVNSPKNGVSEELIAKQKVWLAQKISTRILKIFNNPELKNSYTVEEQNLLRAVLIDDAKTILHDALTFTWERTKNDHAEQLLLKPFSRMKTIFQEGLLKILSCGKIQTDNDLDSLYQAFKVL